MTVCTQKRGLEKQPRDIVLLIGKDISSVRALPLLGDRLGLSWLPPGQFWGQRACRAGPGARTPPRAGRAGTGWGSARLGGGLGASAGAAGASAPTRNYGRAGSGKPGIRGRARASGRG